VLKGTDILITGGYCRSLPVLRISLALIRSLLLSPRCRRGWRDIAISHAQRATLRVASPTWRGSGSSGSRPFLPPLRTRFRRVRSCEVLHKPFAIAWSRYPTKGNRLSPLCTGALAPAGVGSGRNAGCCAGVSLALSCALVRVIATNLGSARRWRVDRRKGRWFNRTPAGRQDAGRLRRRTSEPGSPGRASHAGIDYCLTMSCGEEARPWVGQPGK
jgi:hypothetical protein